jgi:hypothetical protein
MSIIATIDVVAGDNLPLVTLTLFDKSSGTTLDVSQSTVTVYFQQVGTPPGTDVNGNPIPGGTAIPCANVTDGTNGQVSFYFPNGVTNVTPGNYEGEIIISNSASLRQTVYDTLRFRVRAP